ncbi:MAG: SRPBCC domain-containing protein [Alicyclobacillus sp.]|nr:SRPBCC domain-containing protein [Alicyclobacillus sp.]
MHHATSDALPDIRHTVTLHAPVQNVWDAVATSSGLAGWWMPNTLEPVPGRDFVLHAGPYGDSECKVTEVDPPHRLAFRWDADWHVVFELREGPQGETQLTLVHGGWSAAKATRFGQPHAVVREIMDGGWEKLLHERLPAYLQRANPESPDSQRG